MTLVIPVAVLLFFGGSGIITLAANPVPFLVPGTIALGIVAAGLVNLGIATAYERHYGVLKRQGVEVDLLAPTADLASYRLVAAPSLYVLDEDVADRLRDEGVEVGVVLELAGQMRIVDVFDPDGNRVQLAEHLVG